MNKKATDRSIILVLLLVTLVFRLWTIMMIHTGIDERDYWYSAKAISQQGVDYPYINHRTVRWGVIAPVALQQLVTGVRPNAYYVMPVLNSLLQTALLYLLGKRLFNRRTAALATLCLIFFPYQIRAASQIRPEIFSITYILAMVYFFTGYLYSAERRKQLASLALAGLMMLVAYESKITNLFFMPGIFVLIFMYAGKNRIRDSVLFGAIPLAGYALETVLYGVFTGYRFGNLQIISANHLEGMESIRSFIEVFNRYLPPYLQFYWQIPFIVFAALAVYSIARKRDKELFALIVPALSFFFFITFTISGVKPLKMAEPFINRYFSAVLPFVFLVICRYVDLFMGKYPRLGISSRRFMAITLSGTAAFMVVFSLPVIPSQLRQYIRPPFSPEHPFALNRVYRAELNRAWTEGRAIIGADGNAGTNACATASWYYLDAGNYAGKSAPRPKSIQLDVGGKTIKCMSLDGRIPAAGQPVLNVVRSPFRAHELPYDKIDTIESEDFPED